MKVFALTLAFAMFLGLAGGPAAAVEPDEVLQNPVLEQRARAISKELRCVVCQNQAIDESDAELARDMRLLVRERLLVGDSDDEVLDYMVARYGDFVLLRPPMKAVTFALWFGPVAIVLLGIIVAVTFVRRQMAGGGLTSGEQTGEQAGGTQGAAVEPAAIGLSTAEQKRLNDLLARDDEQ